MSRDCPLFTLLLLAISLYTAWPASAQDATPVFVTDVQRMPFVDRIEALGTLRANEAVTLSATVTETVTAVHFEDGQRVAKGHVLIEMTSREEHAQLEEAQSTLVEAQRQFQRVQELVKNGLAPQSTVDERRREQETAHARLLAIQSRLQDRLVIAPFAGIVGIRNISVGALVEPGDVITTLDDDSVMKLDFSVPSTYLNVIEPGLPVIARARALGNTEFAGTISGSDFRIDPVTRSVTVRAILPNEQKRLRPGLLMTVELQNNAREAIVIPEEALIPQARRHFVFVIEQQAAVTTAQYLARKREVTLGARRPGEVEVLQGLEVGERIVTHGTLRVQPDAPVMVRAIDAKDVPLKALLEQQADGKPAVAE